MFGSTEPARIGGSSGQDRPTPKEPPRQWNRRWDWEKTIRILAHTLCEANRPGRAGSGLAPGQKELDKSEIIGGQTHLEREIIPSPRPERSTELRPRAWAEGLSTSQAKNEREERDRAASWTVKAAKAARAVRLSVRPSSCRGLCRSLMPRALDKARRQVRQA